MKKIFFFLIFFLNLEYLHASDKIVYLDIQYIIDNSDIGQLYKKKIKSEQSIIKSSLLKKENEIKDKQKEINNQKNILKKNELDKKIKNLNILLADFQKKINANNSKILNEKKKYSSEILKILNPLLTKYVEKNNISLVIEKKNIIVGIKTLDITLDILELINKETKSIVNEN